MIERSLVRKNSGGRQHTAAQPAARDVRAAFTALTVVIEPTCMMTSARPLQVSAEILATTSRCSSVRTGPSPVLPAIQNPPQPCEILSSSIARKPFSLIRPSSVVGVGGAGNTPLNSSFMPGLLLLGNSRAVYQIGTEDLEGKNRTYGRGPVSSEVERDVGLRT